MLIEFTGCTGSGKSSIALALVAELQKRLQQVHLLDFDGKIIYDLFILPWFPLFAFRNLKFCMFAYRILKKNENSIPTGLNILRNFAKKMAVCESFQYKTHHNTIVWDEGPIHSIHNLFVC